MKTFRAMAAFVAVMWALACAPAQSQTFQQVIDDINTSINANGTQAITGTVLNTILIEMMTYTQSVALGGCIGGSALSAVSTNATSIKASAGTLCSMTWLNTTDTLMDIRFYNTSGVPDCSSATNLVFNFVAQGNTINPGATIALGYPGLAFSNGIGFCITGANTNTDTTNAVTGLNLNYAYR